MNLIPYRENLFPPFTAMQNKLNRLFDEFVPETFAVTPREFWPQFDVFELKDKFVLKADLPGIEAKDINISYLGNTLMIEGERKFEETDKPETWFYKERAFGQFQRTIRLPVPIKADNVEAIDHAGVLTIVLPKTEEAKTRKIPVKLH
jgi:HSP20 family protein